jgi:twinkle protein
MITIDGFEDKKLLEPPQPCPNAECTSSDGFHIWQKGEVIDGYCFVCGRASEDPYGDLSRLHGDTPPNVGRTSPVLVTNSPAQSPKAKGVSVEDGLSHPIRGIPDRGISYSTAEHFGVRVGVSSTDGETPIYTLFPRYREGNHVGYKQRIPDGLPPYLNSGGSDVELFGSHVCKPQGKKLYITEGEYDALSVYQALKEGSNLPGYHPNVCSLSAGSAHALKDFAISSSLLDGYEELVLVFDNDEAGKKARDAICKAFAGRVSFVTIPHPFKDANEMAVGGKNTDLKWLCLTHAKKYQPDGIVRARTLKADLRNAIRECAHTYPDTMPKLNEMLYGPWPGSIVTITSGSGCGKTQFLRELFYHLLSNYSDPIAGLFLEEDKMETIRGIMSLHMGKRLNLPDTPVTEEEEDEAFEALFDNDRVMLYTFFGGMDDSSLLSKLRYFAITGHKFIFLDHLSMVVGADAKQGDERLRLDALMHDLAKFVKEYQVTLFNVVHLRKADSSGVPFELGAVPSVDDLRGSGSIKQYSWDVIALSRNQQHENEYCANITEATVLKSRLTGRTGTADYLYFNGNDGRMYNVDKPVDYRKVTRRGIH